MRGTYRGENGPQEVGDGESARAVFNCYGDSVQRRSSDDGVGAGSSSKRRIGTRGSRVAARQRWLASATVAGVWAKFARNRVLFIRVFG
jgi:hypothetical protein